MSSVPDVHANVERAAKVKVYAQKINGDDFEEEISGLFARAFQHEVDHLDGILFIDRVSQSEKNDIKDSIAELEFKYSGSK